MHTLELRESQVEPRRRGDGGCRRGRGRRRAEGDARARRPPRSGEGDCVEGIEGRRGEDAVRRRGGDGEGGRPAHAARRGEWQGSEVGAGPRVARGLVRGFGLRRVIRVGRGVRAGRGVCAPGSAAAGGAGAPAAAPAAGGRCSGGRRWRCGRGRSGGRWWRCGRRPLRRAAVVLPARLPARAAVAAPAAPLPATAPARSGASAASAVPAGGGGAAQAGAAAPAGGTTAPAGSGAGVVEAAGSSGGAGTAAPPQGTGAAAGAAAAGAPGAGAGAVRRWREPGPQHRAAAQARPRSRSCYPAPGWRCPRPPRPCSPAGAPIRGSCRCSRTRSATTRSCSATCESVVDPVHAQADRHRLRSTASRSGPRTSAARDLITEIAALDPSVRPERDRDAVADRVERVLHRPAQNPNRLHLAFVSQADYQRRPRRVRRAGAAAGGPPGAVPGGARGRPAPDSGRGGRGPARPTRRCGASPRPRPRPPTRRCQRLRLARGPAGGSAGVALICGPPGADRWRYAGLAAGRRDARLRAGDDRQASRERREQLGPQLDKFEADFGFHGAPWCGIFAGHALQAAGLKVPHIGRLGRGDPGPRSASGDGPFAERRAAGQRDQARRPGHVRRHRARRDRHQVDSAGVHTIAGNTGQSNVSETTYSPSSVTGVVRPEYAAGKPGSIPGVWTTPA